MANAFYKEGDKVTVPPKTWDVPPEYVSVCQIIAKLCGKTRAPLTVKSHLTSLKTVYFHLTGKEFPGGDAGVALIRDPTKWAQVDKCVKMMKDLVDNGTYKPGTMRTKMEIIFLLIDALRDPELRTCYYKLRQSYMILDMTNKLNQASGQMSESTQKNWVSWEWLRHVRIPELRRAWRDDPENYSKYALYLYLVLYARDPTDLPPLRNDYANMFLFPPASSHEDLDAKKQNYIRQAKSHEKDSRYRLVINSFKTVRRFGATVIPVPKTVGDIITEGLVFPRKYLLTLMTDLRAPLDQNTEVLARQIDGNKCLGPSQFRKLYVSQVSSKNPGNMYRAARIMMHGVNTHCTYFKIDCNRPDVLDQESDDSAPSTPRTVD